MIYWQTFWPAISKISGWEVLRRPVDDYANWYWDCTAYTFVNLWFMPYRIPGLYSDTDKWVSQFTLNGIKASNICRPS